MWIGGSGERFDKCYKTETRDRQGEKENKNKGGKETGVRETTQSAGVSKSERESFRQRFYHHLPKHKVPIHVSTVS